jgi:glycosyltransferase involved in cell wall biosynthesis
LGYIGRLTEEKGVLDLIESVRELREEGHNIYLHIAGGGKLESILNKNFIKFYGVLPHTEAHLFYQNIDILVLPSKTKTFWKEQFGRVLVEATASGKIVLGSSSGAIPEVISKIGLGEVFEEGNVLDLKKKILTLVKIIQSPNYKSEMENAIIRTIAFSSHESVGKRLVEVMRDDG